MRKSTLRPGDSILADGSLISMPSKGNGKQYEEWHKARTDLNNLLSHLLGTNAIVMAVGAPMRHASYIYGKPKDFLE